MKVQKKIEDNKHRSGRSENIKYILSGKLFCECSGKMVGESGKSKNGKIHAYYKCFNNKINKTCNKKAIPKDWLEKIIVDYTKSEILNDKFIEFITEQVVQIQKENVENTELTCLENNKKEIEKTLKNIMDAIEKGIFTDTTKDRLLELEGQKAKIENAIKLEQIRNNAPKVTKDELVFYLKKYINGDLNSEAYLKLIIDTFINTIIVYEDKILIAYNFTGV